MILMSSVKVTRQIRTQGRRVTGQFVQALLPPIRFGSTCNNIAEQLLKMTINTLNSNFK